MIESESRGKHTSLDVYFFLTTILYLGFGSEIRKLFSGFCSGPMVKSLHSQFREHEFNPWSAKITHAM